MRLLHCEPRLRALCNTLSRAATFNRRQCVSKSHHLLLQFLIKDSSRNFTRISQVSSFFLSNCTVNDVVFFSSLPLSIFKEKNVINLSSLLKARGIAQSIAGREGNPLEKYSVRALACSLLKNALKKVCSRYLDHVAHRPEISHGGGSTQNCPI